MELITLSGENFCCFSSFSVSLENTGLVWVTGENKDSKSALNNGSGKSSLFKALTWCLYGKTIDNVSGDGVIKNGRTKAIVDVEIAVGEHNYKVVRARMVGKPSLTVIKDRKIVRLPKKELQSLVDRIVGLDYISFKNTCFFGQNDSSRFAEPGTRDSERKEVLHKILNLDIFKKCHEETRKRRLSKRIELDNVEKKISNCEARIEEQNVEHLKVKESEFKKNTQFELKRLEDSKNNIVSEEVPDIEEKTKEALLVTKRLEKLKEKDNKKNIDEITKKITYLSDKIKKVSKEKDDSFRKIQQALSVLKVTNDQLSMLDGSNCPVCNSLIKKGKAKNYKTSLLNKKKDLKNELLNLKAEKKLLQSEQNRLAKKFNKFVEKLEKTKGLKRKICSETERLNTLSLEMKIKMDSFQNAKERSQEKLDSIDSKIKELVSKKNPYSELVEQSLEKLEFYTSQFKKEEKKRKKVVSELTNIEFWFRAYSNQGLPSFVLDSTMPVLSKTTNKYLEILSDGDIVVDFSTQRDKKSSNEKRDEITISFDVEGIKNAPLSGGQMRKVSIATDLALADLASSHSGSKTPNILCLDEALSGLDKHGVRRVLMLLQELRKTRSSIFVISHDPDLGEIFEKCIYVTKSGGTSTLKIK